MGLVWLIYSSTFFPGLDLFSADPAQPLTTAGGEELDDLSVDT